jgi:hypothetical protein
MIQAFIKKELLFIIMNHLAWVNPDLGGRGHISTILWNPPASPLGLPICKMCHFVSSINKGQYRTPLILELLAFVQGKGWFLVFRLMHDGVLRT